MQFTVSVVDVIAYPGAILVGAWCEGAMLYDFLERLVTSDRIFIFANGVIKLMNIIMIKMYLMDRLSFMPTVSFT